nr:MAG TPA: H-NS histone family [Caudoviricetes sp.]
MSRNPQLLIATSRWSIPMCTKRIYQVDYNDKVIGYWTLTDGEDPISAFIRELKQQKIEEIRIEMKNYGITIDDLKEVDK